MLEILKARFTENKYLHTGLNWSDVENVGRASAS